MAEKSSEYTWKFHRIGGLDQVTLRTAEELDRLAELDPKLWVALSCPASGLQFDARTLALIDTDNDGRIRAPEVVAATRWLGPRLANTADIVDAPSSLPLDRIATQTPEGKRLAETAASILASLGKEGAQSIAHNDVAEALKHAAEATYNGDGVIWANPDFGPGVAGFVTDALAVVGGVGDASGKPGINKNIAMAFVDALTDWKAWQKNVDNAATPLGPQTAEAWRLLQELGPKIDDYFLRCDMASFAPWSCGERKEDDTIVVQEAGLLHDHTLEDMPLARVEADRPLSFSNGLNPAWRDRMDRFVELVRPLLPSADALTREGWKALRKAFDPYAEAVAKKPKTAKVEVTVPPSATVDGLGRERVDAILSGGMLDDVLAVIAKDAAAPAAATDIADLERLVLYHAHLYRLLMNFVSFYDFYSLRCKAIFQYGTLFLDGRSCELCLPVADPSKHGALASMSQLCLVYCRCARAKDKPEDGEETMDIVAAVTAGNSAMLVEGRNGVFVDTTGRDWDATVTKVVSNPIGLRQAVWDPYRRFGRMLAEQISKIATDKQATVTKSLGQTAEKVVSGKAPAPAFDIGKSVGIFAAVGIALGALGTAVGSIVQALGSLAWWQFPLILVGAFLLISGPSIVLAWLKLRKRTLGPLLEASGWAVNSLVPINFTLGGKLTATAELPPNATRSYNDPLKKPSRWPLILSALIGIAIGLGVWVWIQWPNLPIPWK